MVSVGVIDGGEWEGFGWFVDDDTDPACGTAKPGPDLGIICNHC